MDNGGLRYGAMDSALRPPLPHRHSSRPSQAELSRHFADGRLTAKRNIIPSIRGSRPPGGRHQIGTPAGFKSESVATHSNRKPATDSDLKPAGVPI